MLFVFVLSCELCLLSWGLVSFSRHYRLQHFQGSRTVPGQQPDWVLGNIRHMGMLRGVPLHRGCLEYQKQFGDYFQMFVGKSNFLVLCKPEHAQHILSKRNMYDAAPSTIEKFALMFPLGMFALRGTTHHRHARIILPLLRKARIIPFIPMISDTIDLLLYEWERAYQHQLMEGLDPDIHKGLKHTHIHRHLLSTALDIITEIAYGETAHTINNVCDDLINHNDTNKHIKQDITTLAQASAYVTDRFGEITLSGLPLWLASWILKYEKPYQHSRQIILAYVRSRIAASSDARVTCAAEQINILHRLVGSLSSSSNQTIMENDQNTFNIQEVTDELLAMFTAGYESFATVLSWFIVFVSRYPDVQQRIKDEIRQIIPKQDGIPPPLSQTQLDQLEYMDAVMKETLRLAGQEILIPFYNYHVDPRNWKIDPLKFCPDRFFGENAPDKDHHPYAHMPFGGGAHGCAGQELARVEVKTVMTRLMQHVTFHDTPDNKAIETQRIACVPMDVCVRITWD